MNQGMKVDLPVAVVTGGSAGLGLAIAARLRRAGYIVVILGRDAERLKGACDSLAEASNASETSNASVNRGGSAQENYVLGLTADLTVREQVGEVFQQVQDRFGRLDVLINNVGASDRGTVENMEVERMEEIVRANVVPTLLCSQAALPMLEVTGGVIINVGSMAAKVGARFLGAYPAAKHALAGLTQQMRLEWKERGVHVGLVNPGPIRREDVGRRYDDRVAADSKLPEQAKQPGGGTKVKGVPPELVAQKVLRMIQRRQADVLLPSYLRPLVAIGHLYMPWGDWLLLKFTSSKPPKVN